MRPLMAPGSGSVGGFVPVPFQSASSDLELGRDLARADVAEHRNPSALGTVDLLVVRDQHVAGEAFDALRRRQHERAPIVGIHRLGKTLRRQEVRNRPDLLQLTELLVLPLVQLVLRERRVEQHVRHQRHDCVEVLGQRGERGVGVTVADVERDRRRQDPPASRQSARASRVFVPSRIRLPVARADGHALRGRSGWRPARRSAPEWWATGALRAPSAPSRSSAGSRSAAGTSP